MRNVIILEAAAQDIKDARDFYRRQEHRVGAYFVDSITTDILKLQELSGIHLQCFGFFRMLGTHFPFGSYYRERASNTVVAVVLDLRRDPKWIRNQLKKRKLPNQ